MTTAYINRIATAVPPHDVHEIFLGFAKSLLAHDRRRSHLFRRMVEVSGVEHRYSCLTPAIDPEGAALDADAIYRRGQFPNTATRMRLYEEHAGALAATAVERLLGDDERDTITHLVITSCTGFSAPGIDLELVHRCRLPGSIERTIVGFMGCYAAINGLKLARHIVRSEPAARVLVLNLELCTLHLKETTDLEQILSFLLFGDGCAAALVTAEPRGLAIDSFHAVLVPNSREQITWHIREFGFDMVLSGQVPATIQAALRAGRDEILRGAPMEAIDLWAVHPGGRTVLDAVKRAFDLPEAALATSRAVLRRFGNMSSATVMFVLDEFLRTTSRAATGCAMAFGPGLIAETMMFRAVGHTVRHAVDTRCVVPDHVAGHEFAAG